MTISAKTEFEASVLATLSRIENTSTKAYDLALEHDGRLDKVDALHFRQRLAPAAGPQVKPRSAPVGRRARGHRLLPEMSGRLMRIEATLSQQNKAAGIAPPQSKLYERFRAFLFSREALYLSLRVATIASVFYAAAHGVAVERGLPATPTAHVDAR